MTSLTLVAELPWTLETDGGLRGDESQRHGPVISGSLHERKPRRWVLRLANATDDVRQAIDTAHAATKGGADVLDWQPPDEASTVKVRFLPGRQGYSRSRVSAVLWQIQVVFEEALST